MVSIGEGRVYFCKLVVVRCFWADWWVASAVIVSDPNAIKLRSNLLFLL